MQAPQTCILIIFFTPLVESKFNYAAALINGLQLLLPAL